MEAGFDYVCDWVLDDQPVVLKTRAGPIVNIPYTQECNDVAMMLIQHHAASEYSDRAIDQFEQLHHDARTSARVMAIVVHPYIMGAPHRLKYFRRAIEHIRAAGSAVFWTGEQILDWYTAERARLGLVSSTRYLALRERRLPRACGGPGRRDRGGSAARSSERSDDRARPSRPR